MSVEIRPAMPAEPSPVLLELAREYNEANKKFETVGAKYAADCRRRRGYDPSPDAFRQTTRGAELDAECVRTIRRLRAARALVESVDLGGVIVKRQDVDAAAWESVYRAAADHGHDPVQWPSELRSEILARLRSARVVSPHEIASKRRASLRDGVRAAIERAQAAFGENPAAWPDEAIDEVARVRARLDAFEYLAADAGLNPDWRRDRVQ